MTLLQSEQDEIREVEVEKISVNPFQPRRYFSNAELEELAQSIQAVGLIHPPVVRPLPDDGYELISGERRFRAAQLAGLMKIPVLVRKSSNSVSAQAALIENIQRVDLNPIEVAKALRSLMDQFCFNQDELAQRIGKKRSTVANYLRLLSLLFRWFLSYELSDFLYLLESFRQAIGQGEPERAFFDQRRFPEEKTHPSNY